MEEHSNNPVIPTKDDILCGSGNSKSTHPGNQQLTRIVLTHLAEYLAAETRREMVRISKLILLEVSSQGARFLRKHPIFDEWYVQEDPKAARDKISHMLRDLKRTSINRTEPRQNRVRGLVNVSRSQGGEQEYRNPDGMVPRWNNPLLLTTPCLIGSNTLMGNDSNGLTSYLKCQVQHGFSTMLGGVWKPEVRCETIPLPNILLDHDVEHQQEVERLHSVLEHKVSCSEEWEFLPDGDETNSDVCYNTISFLDHNIEPQQEAESFLISLGTHDGRRLGTLPWSPNSNTTKTI